MPDGADLVAATAACVAAALVAWQSWETRKSAKASREAAKAAAAGLETANHALDIARREEGHSRVLVSEAQRARIDAALPAISVLPQRKIFWPPPLSMNPYSEPWLRGSPDAAFTLPADARVALGVRGRIAIHNGSQKIVQLMIDYIPVMGGARVLDEVITIEPGETVSKDFLAWTWIDQWVAGGTEGPVFEGQLPFIHYSDQLDSGGSIGWEFAVSHAPIYESNEAEPGRFRLVDVEPSAGRSQPAPPVLTVRRENRSYWLSRKNGIELPAPYSVEPSTATESEA